MKPTIGRHPGEAGLTIGFIVGCKEKDVQPHCGVRDYTRTLASALRETGVDARVMAPDRWSLGDAAFLLRTMRAERFDVIHLQYPSLGHRRSLLPHLLGVVGAAPHSVVTLHEHSALPRVQRTANRLFRVCFDEMLFTTEYDATAFGAAPGTPVIPIGSNVPVHPGRPVRDGKILYFGQIRPDKGLAAFLNLAELAAAKGDPGHFVVIGSTPVRWRDYATALRVQATRVEWIEDLPFAAVAEAMATAAAAYLPYPDGASLRRGSLIAALANGLPVIAPVGQGTTAALRTALLEAATPAAALAQLRALRAQPALGQVQAARGRALARKFDWQVIAGRHLALYRGLLAKAPGKGRAYRALPGVARLAFSEQKEEPR